MFEPDKAIGIGSNANEVQRLTMNWFFRKCQSRSRERKLWLALPKKPIHGTIPNRFCPRSNVLCQNRKTSDGFMCVFGLLGEGLCVYAIASIYEGHTCRARGQRSKIPWPEMAANGTNKWRCRFCGDASCKAGVICPIGLRWHVPWFCHLCQPSTNHWYKEDISNQPITICPIGGLFAKIRVSNIIEQLDKCVFC